MVVFYFMQKLELPPIIHSDLITRSDREIVDDVVFLEKMVHCYRIVYGEEPWNEGAIPFNGDYSDRIPLSWYNALPPQESCAYEPCYPVDKLLQFNERHYTPDETVGSVVSAWDTGSEILAYTSGLIVKSALDQSRMNELLLDAPYFGDTASSRLILGQVNQKLLEKLGDDTPFLFNVDILSHPNHRGNAKLFKTAANVADHTITQFNSTHMLGLTLNGSEIHKMLHAMKLVEDLDVFNQNGVEMVFTYTSNLEKLKKIFSMLGKSSKKIEILYEEK